MLKCNLIEPACCKVIKKDKLLSVSCYSLSCRIDWRWRFANKNNYCSAPDVRYVCR